MIFIPIAVHLDTVEVTGKSLTALFHERVRGKIPLYINNFLNLPIGTCDIKSNDMTIAKWIKAHRLRYSTAHLGK